jgi:hypothetical protein
MAQTLRYLDELLANYPDNTAGLITPENVRDQLVSTVAGVGFLADTTEVTVPITDGVPTLINPLLTAPVTLPELWLFDGNNLGVSNYTALTGTVLPAGYTKILSIVAVAVLEKTAGGTDVYDLQFTRTGVPIGVAETVAYTAAGVQTITVVVRALADVSAPDTYGLTVAGLGTNDDLQLHSFEMNLTDAIMLTDPNA